jgi:hypothetical protein
LQQPRGSQVSYLSARIIEASSPSCAIPKYRRYHRPIVSLPHFWCDGDAAISWNQPEAHDGKQESTVIIETAYCNWRQHLPTRLFVNALGLLLLVASSSAQTAIKREVVVGRATVQLNAAPQIAAAEIRPL